MNVVHGVRRWNRNSPTILLLSLDDFSTELLARVGIHRRAGVFSDEEIKFFLRCSCVEEKEKYLHVNINVRNDSEEKHVIISTILSTRTRTHYIYLSIHLAIYPDKCCF